MRECYGNIWDFHKQHKWVVIPTNGMIKKDGSTPMGGGKMSVASQAKKRYPRLPFELGERIKSAGNHVHLFPDILIATFPTKEHWKAPSKKELIERSAKELALYFPVGAEVYLVEPGTGNGGMFWGYVKQVIAPILDDRFTVVHLKKPQTSHHHPQCQWCEGKQHCLHVGCDENTGAVVLTCRHCNYQRPLTKEEEDADWDTWDAPEI